MPLPVRVPPLLALLVSGWIGLGCASRSGPLASWASYPTAYGPGYPPPTTGSPPRSASAPAPRYCSPEYQSQFGWPDPAKAARVCACESSGRPNARSANGRYLGLFQFSEDAWRSLGGGDPFDPWTNSHHAHALWSKKGWKPWPHCGRK